MEWNVIPRNEQMPTDNSIVLGHLLVHRLCLCTTSRISISSLTVTASLAKKGGREISCQQNLPLCCWLCCLFYSLYFVHSLRLNHHQISNSYSCRASFSFQTTAQPPANLLFACVLGSSSLLIPPSLAKEWCRGV